MSPMSVGEFCNREVMLASVAAAVLAFGCVRLPDCAIGAALFADVAPGLNSTSLILFWGLDSFSLRFI